MAIVRGPFDLKWGDNTITDVEEINITHEISSDDYETLGGRTLEIDGSAKASAIITLLASDIQALSVVLPQYWVANGGVMSTGETVSNAYGAMDFAPLACNALTYHNLDIISCGNPGQVTRLVNCRTKLESIEVDNKVEKLKVKFVGETAADEATVQFFKENSLAVVS